MPPALDSDGRLIFVLTSPGVSCGALSLVASGAVAAAIRAGALHPPVVTADATATPTTFEAAFLPAGLALTTPPLPLTVCCFPCAACNCSGGAFGFFFGCWHAGLDDCEGWLPCSCGGDGGGLLPALRLLLAGLALGFT